MRRSVLLTGVAVVAVSMAAGLSTGCTYVRLARPSVVKQVTPEVARLVNYLPRADQPNEAMIAKLFAIGGLSTAERIGDGIMRESVRIPSGEFIWVPTIIVMPEPGELELTFINEDDFSHHAAYLPSNGDRQYLHLPMYTGGRATLSLDGPGYYWFACPVANHEGRGMLGLIIVEGDVPPDARLDRPPQPRPGES
ncbi:MAG TPA: MSMEG_3727 family PQQ-associated protein [Woeseiaceae bacterium]|nr:MSMEG_3727 family PQQ-associated protein [Woeseiaceae bacterium]